MLTLNSLSLFQFKNYPNRQFRFGDRIVVICGNNGKGKTNVLDAIHYLCFTKSYFSVNDAINVLQGANGFRIEGQFELGDNQETAVCVLRENGKKEFSVNSESYTRFSDHIGRYPCVVIAPDDAILITGGSEKRRAFLDALLSQLDSGYLRDLINYNKILQQRNSLLKNNTPPNVPDESLLKVLDEQLISPGMSIFNKRRNFLVSFLPRVKRLYTEIAGQEEDLSLLYESNLLENSFDDLLMANRQKDLILQRTTTGIHRDDLVIHLGNQLLKNIASQGQRKSLLFALKFSELEILTTAKGFPPLLLLDDVFEKLDENRIHKLLHKVCVENEGQVFITDTHEERIRTQLGRLNESYELIQL